MVACWIPSSLFSSYACTNLHLHFVGLHVYFLNLIICIYTAEPLCKCKPHVLFHSRNVGTLQGMTFLFSVMLYMQILVTLILQTCTQAPYFCNCWVLWRKPSVHALLCIDPSIILLAVCLLSSKQFSWLDDLQVCSCKICCLVCEPWTTEVMKTFPHKYNCGSMECFE